MKSKINPPISTAQAKEHTLNVIYGAAVIIAISLATAALAFGLGHYPKVTLLVMLGPPFIAMAWIFGAHIRYSL